MITASVSDNELFLILSNVTFNHFDDFSTSTRVERNSVVVSHSFHTGHSLRLASLATTYLHICGLGNAH